ncbi:hypothetical protein V6N13_029435 [Hibiscus sabdariffa]|uniref:Uncharacterized protein n=2 Tax=Hibiscus sabdariffa TaxID=183260 RepID=A0ABR2T9X7_9ROSI
MRPEDHDVQQRLTYRRRKSKQPMRMTDTSLQDQKYMGDSGQMRQEGIPLWPKDQDVQQRLMRTKDPDVFSALMCGKDYYDR